MDITLQLSPEQALIYNRTKSTTILNAIETGTSWSMSYQEGTTFTISTYTMMIATDITTPGYTIADLTFF